MEIQAVESEVVKELPGSEYEVRPELKAWSERAVSEGLPLNLPQMFRRCVEKFADRPYVGAHNGDVYEFETYAEIYNKDKAFASALLEIGMHRGDRVANFSNNRPEWPVVDIGSSCAGCVHVPMYATLSNTEMAYIVKDSGARVIVVAKPEHLLKVMAVADDCPDLEHIVTIAPPTAAPTTRKHIWTWNEFLEYGRIHLQKHTATLEYLAGEMKPWDVTSIVYTSGTTGTPKGVLLCHGNFISQCSSMAPIIHATPEDVELCFLPLAHVFERQMYYVMTYAGASIGYAMGIHSVMSDQMLLRPTLVPSVPVLFSKIYQRVMAKLGNSNKSFNWALRVGRSYRVAQRAGRVSQVLRAKQSMARSMVFGDILRKTGGNMRFYISGGAPLPKEVGEFFFDVGLTILEGYGLTETSPVITLNPPEAPKLGSVGLPIPDVQVKQDSDGELLVKGPLVMRGYFKRPNDTAAAFDSEGWFHTGDIVTIDEEGYVSITDRKKNILVLNNGKNVAPSAIEQSLVNSPWIAQAVLLGNNQPCVGALIVPNFDKVKEWADEQKIFFDPVDLAKNERLHSILMGEVRDACHDLSNYEKVKKIVVLPRPFMLEKGELTHSLKVKVRVVEEHFATEIAALFAKEVAD